MRVAVAAVAALVGFSNAIYEDQVGEFDWHRAGLGEVMHASLPSKSSSSYHLTKGMYVASEANVLAKLDMKTSVIEWRQVLPENTAIEDIVLCETQDSLVSVSLSSASAATSRDATLVRQWDAVHGHLNWETYVPIEEIADVPYSEAYEVRGEADESILALVRNYDVTIFNLQSGNVLRTAHFPNTFDRILTTKLSVDATKLFVLGIDSKTKESIVVQVVLKSAVVSALELANSSQVVGLYRDNDDDRVVAVSIIEDASALQFQALYDLSLINKIPIDSLQLANTNPSTSLTFTGIDISVAHSFVVLVSNGRRLYARINADLTLKVLASLPSTGLLIDSVQAKGILFHTSLQPAQNRITVSSYHADMSPSVHIEASIDVALYGRAITRGFVGVNLKKTTKAVSVVRVALVMADASLILVSNEKSQESVNPGLVWIREEALAYGKQMYWVTPASSAIEKEALTVIPSYTEELALEAKKFMRLFQSFGAVAESSSSDNAYVFGFSKLLILATSTGKLYALASETGNVVWSRYIGKGYQLLVTRDHPAFGAGAEILLVSPEKQLIWIDAEDGRVLATESPSTTDDAYVVLLPKQKHHDSDESVPRRLVGVVASENNADRVHVTLYPSQKPEDQPFYFYRYNQAAHAFQGYKLTSSNQAKLVWSVVLPQDESIVARSVQAENTAIESSVTITGDDSLLVKYLNPHLFGVATLDAHNVLQVSLIDAVSGRIIHRTKHHQVGTSVQMVQSENWLVYSFYSLKNKRTELVSLALFERAIGARDLNPWVRPSWSDFKSSFDPKAPYVLQKSFIYPSPITSLGVTMTARGITPQYILVGMANGQIFKLGRNLIDPRVPEAPPTPEQQAEGLVQYSPYIQYLAMPFSMVSHNQTLYAIKTIKSTPTNLESTSLTFAFGLDLYY
ncbi:hypothetical protein THRCLA_11841, partial [Thraustotheca clavata]